MMLLFLLLTGCGGGEKAEKKAEEMKKVDLDLTQMSTTLAYAQVCDISADPTDYIGKSIRMAGYVDQIEDDTTGKVYYACFVLDGTGCCTASLEFSLEHEAGEKKEYPSLWSDIVIEGSLVSYEEDGDSFCRIDVSDWDTAEQTA